MVAPKKVTIAKILVDRQLFENETIASRWIMAGKVISDGQRVDKPGQLVSVSAQIRVKGLDNPYVSRGGLKLAGALRDFEVDTNGRVVLDSGASTGGFTDCLLKAGAKMVYSVDVGHGQLDWSLITDLRVKNMERTNITDVTLDMLVERPTLAVADLSYLSLRVAVPAISELLELPSEQDPLAGRMVCLVKPLFETKHHNAIESPDTYKEILFGLTEYAQSIGLAVLGVTNSPIRGSSGTVEFFLYLGKNSDECLSDSHTNDQIDAAIGRALST